MPNGAVRGLSRRERQIMDIVFARGSATAGEVLEALPDPPSYSAVRALLRVLEEKGRLTHRRDGARYVYSATEPHGVAAPDGPEPGAGYLLLVTPTVVK